MIPCISTNSMYFCGFTSLFGLMPCRLRRARGLRAVIIAMGDPEGCRKWFRHLGNTWGKHHSYWICSPIWIWTIWIGSRDPEKLRWSSVAMARGVSGFFMGQDGSRTPRFALARKAAWIWTWHLGCFNLMQSASNSAGFLDFEYVIIRILVILVNFLRGFGVLTLRSMTVKVGRSWRLCVCRA